MDGGPAVDGDKQHVIDLVERGVDGGRCQVVRAKHGEVQVHVLAASDVRNVEVHTVVVEETLTADSHRIVIAASLERKGLQFSLVAEDLFEAAFIDELAQDEEVRILVFADEAFELVGKSFAVSRTVGGQQVVRISPELACRDSHV